MVVNGTLFGHFTFPRTYMEAKKCCKHMEPMANMSTERRRCKPSRKLFEQECHRLETSIQELRDKLSALKDSTKELHTQLQALSLQKSKRFTAKTDLESTVRSMSTEINKLSERLAQLQSKIHYRDMKKLEDAIRKLQVHLDSHHFKLSEEKKIVAEIDKLNRSKRVVGEYLEVQSALKNLRSSQYKKRSERDRCMKDIAALRGQEESIRSEISINEFKETQLKSDMDALYENRQTLKVQFTQQQQEYAEQKKADKAEQQKRLEESKRTSTCAAVRCQRPVMTEVKSEEVLTCEQLIEFCERLNSHSCADPRTIQRNKKKRISYTTDVLSKFISLGMSPPMTVHNAIGLIDALKEKLSELTQQEPPHSAVPSETNTPGTPPLGQQMSAEDLCTIQLPDDGSENSSYTKQLSTNDEDLNLSVKEITSILDSIVYISDLRSSVSS